MDVFSLRDKLIAAYRQYARSFIQIKDDHISSCVEDSMAEGAFWPDPLIQLNPRFASGGSVRNAIDDGYLDHGANGSSCTTSKMVASPVPSTSISAAP